MLISRISDETEGVGKGDGVEVEPDDAHEYQTASELFDLMTKNRHFDDNDDDSLTAQDLVLLYKNIDIGTRLINNATEVRHRRPNQHVETVVYDEPESDSDLSENYSAEDLHNVFKINQERMNIFDKGSFDNILCHKLSGLEIKGSDLTTDYNRQFLFKDPYIKEQLKGLNLMASCSEFEDLFPTSLLDYICCKRLEDNYNFYMDNIIKYVQHTIEQLKRISNGDYLTDRAKEKWAEVKKNESPKGSKTKVLATSTSIPLHVECKKTGQATWDDIVHSEVDVRSLSKILERKIIVEIPKLMCGSYRLFSKRYADNLIISCKRDEEDSTEPRLDVVLKLQRSQTGQVISNISSIMILQTTPAAQDLSNNNLLPITFNNSSDKTVVAVDDSAENSLTAIEFAYDSDIHFTSEDTEGETFQLNDESILEKSDYRFSDAENIAPYDMASNQYSSESSEALRDLLADQPGLFPISNETTCNFISPDELHLTMQRLNMQNSLPEESGEDVSVSASANSKRKSPLRVRIKSPYENKSYILEEKKRKRLLEIREKREKKKIALGETAKVSKNKYTMGTVTPQASSSVTKLSITNKSFYNSIYGQTLNDCKPKGKTQKLLKKDLSPLDIPIEQIQEEYSEPSNFTPDSDKKYVNRSYYLDDTETEMMYLEKNRDVKTCSNSTSAVSNDFSANMNILSQFIGPSGMETNEHVTTADEQNQSLDDTYDNSKDAGCSDDITRVEILVPTNSRELQDDGEPKKLPVTVECRKSIDKLYSLMKTLGKTSMTDLKTPKSKNVVKTALKMDAITGNSTIQGSESGTSLKHHLTSSSPSCFSFGKANTENLRPKGTRKNEPAVNVMPKVIISSRLQVVKFETDKIKKDRRRVFGNPPPKPVPENPLRAISQLLHEFDNVQKTRQKTIPDGKTSKKPEVLSGDGKNAMTRQNTCRRRSRQDQHKEYDQDKKTTTSRDKRSKPLTPMEIARISLQQTLAENKHADKSTKKKMADVLDEAREARGEAVRGPSKLNSRLHSLAQPKRSYVQAHSEEYQHKYGKSLMADRLQRLATTPPSPTPGSEPIARTLSSPTNRSRAKREITSSVSVKSPPSMQPTDKPRIRHRSSSNSPNRKHIVQTPASNKHNVPESLEAMKNMAATVFIPSHYRNSSPSRELLSGHKTRVPLVPSDIELDSVSPPSIIEEAHELGKKLHRMIDSMITTAPPLTSLTVVQEHAEVNTFGTDIFSDQRQESEFKIDILEDRNVETAVENQSANDNKGEIKDDIFAISGTMNNELQQFNSTTELEKLENALYNQISGAFQKRLRIKKLTLTPKASLQQLFYLQSGDAGSLLVKSAGKLNDSLHDLKAVSVLSNSHLNWNFAQIPVQLATVGYAFPLYRHDSVIKQLNVSRTTITEHSSHGSEGCNKVSQCFKGAHQEPKGEQGSQINVEIATDSKAIDTEKTIEHVSEEHLNALQVVELPIIDIPHIDVPLPNISEAKIPSKDIFENEEKIPSQDIFENDTKIRSKDIFENDIKIPSQDIIFENDTKIPSQDIIFENDTKIRSKDIFENDTKIRSKDIFENDTKIPSQDIIFENDTKIPSQDIIFENDTKIRSKDIFENDTKILSQDIFENDKKIPFKEMIENDKHHASKSSSDNVDYTTSLDMLVRLLNEIQNLTCQKPGKNQSPCTELETILSRAASKEAACDVISITSLDRLRQLESNPSIYSFYISSESSPSRDCITEAEDFRPVFVDKEVNVNLVDKECVHTFTDVPSLLPLSLTVNHSTNVTNSLNGVLSEPSSQSVVSVPEHRALYSNTFFSSQSIKRIIELPRVASKGKMKENKKTDLNEKCEITTPIIEIERIPAVKCSVVVRKNKKYPFENINFDSAIKIKRDILVTLYSILVFTVFAALSLPDMALLEG